MKPRSTHHIAHNTKEHRLIQRMHCSCFLGISIDNLIQTPPPSHQIINPATKSHAFYKPHPPNIHNPQPNLLSIRLLNSSLQRLGVGTHNLSNLILVLEDDECGHGANTEFLGDVWDFVYVNLDEVDVGEFLGEPVFILLEAVFGGRKRGGKGKGKRTYLTTWGAMTLQGPHQVAKQSRTTILLSLMAVWKSGLLWGNRVSISL
jgi:hypothetical protein